MHNILAEESQVNAEQKKLQFLDFQSTKSTIYF